MQTNATLLVPHSPAPRYAKRIKALIVASYPEKRAGRGPCYRNPVG